MYGFMTRSFLHSTEHRQLKAERTAATQQFLHQQEQGKLPTVYIEPACTCSRWPFPHFHPPGTP